MKTTYKQVLEFQGAAISYIRKITSVEGKDGEPVEEKTPDKVTHALRRMLKRLQPIVADYEDRRQDALLLNAATDKQGLLLRDDHGNYKFTRDGEEKLLKAIRSLTAKTAPPFEPFYIEVPKGFDEFLAEDFTGFIFKKAPENGKK